MYNTTSWSKHFESSVKTGDTCILHLFKFHTRCFNLPLPRETVKQLSSFMGTNFLFRAFLITKILNYLLTGGGKNGH